ncbi:MAG: hypothetical protein EBR30_05205 [Cytophagia bacterium]|nr:hypothetical protein [Cytophagia bacterium]
MIMKSTTMNYVHADDTRYPIVYFKVHPILPTLDDMQDVFHKVNELLERPEQAIILVNTRDQKLISSEARIAAGKWLNQIEPKLKDKVKCIFFMESSIWLNIVLKAIFLVAKLLAPTHVLTTPDEVAYLLKKNYNIEMSFRF